MNSEKNGLCFQKFEIFLRIFPVVLSTTTETLEGSEEPVSTWLDGARVRWERLRGPLTLTVPLPA